ncbi:Transcription initiation factor TFIID subunit 5 [Gryllus bimaculatus]|nr:Transcription initiation factor TFIID subunit 5 [Gryllus bimaculatus]
MLHAIIFLGSPMILALIAGQLEDNKNDVIRTGGRWDYYVNMLSQKNFGKVRRNSFLEQNGLFQTISMSINSLPSNKKELYIDFALFMEDVNIKPEVLQTLWEVETKYEVEDIMAYFTKKSLAVCKWNEQFCSSVYGIHDLLLDYLKDQLSCEEYRELHRKLLRRYHKKCSGQYATLPNDNYIYSYIGYHMYHAGEWQLFETIFLDLKFIQSKLRATGPADVIGDFRKYENQIINGNIGNNEKISDIVKFIQVHGLDLYKYQNLDIVQSGLLWRKGSWVYNEAYSIAKKSEQKLYFEFVSEQDLVSHPITLPLPEEIVSACFTNEINKILVSDGNGIIKLWRLDPLRSIKTFRGHHFKVTHIERHPDNRRFLSCSDDGSLKLWCLDHCEVNDRVELNTSGDNLRVSSPQNLQRNWKSMFLDDSPKDESLRTYIKHENAVLCAKFSHSGNEIVSCSKDCFIVWDCESGVSRFTLEVEGDNMATCCTFSWDDTRLFLGDNSQINIYDNKTSESLGSFRNSSNIISVLSVPIDSNKVIVISSEEMQIWEWDEPEISNPVNLPSVATFSLGKISQHSFGKKKCGYVCAAISNDGTHLVTASSDYIISVYDLKMEILIAEHKNYSGIARCLDTYVKDCTPLLLCGSDDRTVKIWRLDQSSTVSSVNLLPYFDSTWTFKEDWQPIVAMPDSKNRVQILLGSEFLQDTPEESQQILVCSVACSGCVFYGCADGQVKMFNFDDGSREVIMKLDNKVTYVQCFQNGNLLLVAAGDNTSLKIWKQDGTVSVCYGQTGPVVRSFLVPNTELLLACNEDAGVKLWDVLSGELSQVLTGRLSKACITSADISEQFNVLVLADATCSFLVATLALHKDSPYISVTSVKAKKIGNNENPAIQCCRISPLGDLIALGLHSGEILVWNLKNLQLVKKLKLHTSPVRDMLYTTSTKSNISPNLDLLVTIGEKIGWWNVTNLLDDNSSNANNLTSNTTNYNGRHWESVTQQREGSFKRDDERDPLLLGCVKLVGSHALKISCSPDSLSFLTVDTSGIVYLLKLLH